MKRTCLLLAFLVLESGQLLFGQLDTLRQPRLAFCEVSAMVTTDDSEVNYFMSASTLFGGKKKGWQNSLHLDVETLDLAKSWGGGKNYYSLQFGKNYSFQRKLFIAKSCTSVGLFMYQFALPGSESRTYGVIVSQSLEFGVSLKKVNISAGFYLAVGYGYFKRYYQVPDYAQDPSKFLAIGNPFVKFTFKNNI